MKKIRRKKENKEKKKYLFDVLSIADFFLYPNSKSRRTQSPAHSTYKSEFKPKFLLICLHRLTPLFTILTFSLFSFLPVFLAYAFIHHSSAFLDAMLSIRKVLVFSQRPIPLSFESWIEKRSDSVKSSASIGQCTEMMT